MITKQISRFVGTLVPLPIFYHLFIYLVLIKVSVQAAGYLLCKKKTFSRRKAYQKPFFKKESVTNNFFTFVGLCPTTPQAL
jgi:hypothetical protein